MSVDPKFVYVDRFFGRFFEPPKILSETAASPSRAVAKGDEKAKIFYFGLKAGAFSKKKENAPVAREEKPPFQKVFGGSSAVFLVSQAIKPPRTSREKTGSPPLSRAAAFGENPPKSANSAFGGI